MPNIFRSWGGQLATLSYRVAYQQSHLFWRTWFCYHTCTAWPYEASLFSWCSTCDTSCSLQSWPRMHFVNFWQSEILSYPTLTWEPAEICVLLLYFLLCLNLWFHSLLLCIIICHLLILITGHVSIMLLLPISRHQNK